MQTCDDPECSLEGPLTRESARQACRTTILGAIERQLARDESRLRSGVLVDALPTLGKSHSAARVGAQLLDAGSMDAKITILTHRRTNRTQLEDLLFEYEPDRGHDRRVTVETLPVFERDCPTARGDHGAKWKQRVWDRREKGVPPGYLHTRLNLPCLGDCEYHEKWERCQETDVLIGHQTHVYITEAIEDRIVIFDEDPGEAFRTDFTAVELHTIFNEYLPTEDGIKASNFDTLAVLRTAEAFADDRTHALEQLREKESLLDFSTVIDSNQGHAYAAMAVLALLESGGENEADDYQRPAVESINLPGSATACYDRTKGTLYIRRPPDLSSAQAVVGLDGTPTTRLWRRRLGLEHVDRVRVLCDECRRRYLHDVLGYRIVQTAHHSKPYSSGRYVYEAEDHALLEAIHRKTGTNLAVITTKKAEEILFGETRPSYVVETAHYGNIRGSNDFEGDEIQVGVVIGSPHPGDQEIQRLAALDGVVAERTSTKATEGKGTALSYGADADPYLHHVREHQVAQAILRFGRTSGATVFVHTAAIPDWMPVLECDPETEGVVRVRAAGERAVIAVLRERGEATTSEIVDSVSIVRRTVLDHLHRLDDEDVIDKEGSAAAYRWIDKDLEGILDSAHTVLPDHD